MAESTVEFLTRPEESDQERGLRALEAGLMWEPGMRMLCGARIVAAMRGVRVFHKGKLVFWSQLALSKKIPDLRDQATVGCLRDQVRDHWEDDSVSPLLCKSTRGALVWTLVGLNGDPVEDAVGNQIRARSEVDCLLMGLGAAVPLVEEIDSPED